MMPIGDEGHHRGGLPIVNLLILAANVAVFFLLQLPSDAFTMGFSAIPKEILSGTDLVGPTPVQLPDGTTETLVHAPGPSPISLTLVTSMFMHGGFAHIAGNMLFLFVFGDNVEHAFGSLLYAVFYLVCGVVASLAHVMFSPESIIPSLGASGAISGVLAGYLVLFPKNRVKVLIGMRFVQEVPALLMIGLWAVFQFIAGAASITESAQTSGVAYMAHIGGFLAGLVLAFLLRGFADRGTPAPMGLRGRPGPF
jgi:membrane associated rhomboid family serine protease